MKEIEIQLALMEQKQTLRHEENRSQLNAIFEQTSRTNGRISKLEVWQGAIKGAVAVLGAMAATALGWLISHGWH